ncbi:hypothetical protein B0H14DRAFT_3852419, partial [Mycena olivaceomarginata]
MSSDSTSRRKMNHTRRVGVPGPPVRRRGAPHRFAPGVPEGAAREAALYPDGAHLTDLKEVWDLLYTMQRPAIAPHSTRMTGCPWCRYWQFDGADGQHPCSCSLSRGEACLRQCFKCHRRALKFSSQKTNLIHSSYILYFDSYPSILITLTLSICPTLL